MSTGKLIAGLALFALHAGCAAPYEFRNDERPAYDDTVTTGKLKEMQRQGARVIDVRLSEDFSADPVLIPDAMYLDPEGIETWAASMAPTDQPVIVYCVKGKWVSQKAANYLRKRGFEVYSLEGGIEAWKDDGQATIAASN